MNLLFLVIVNPSSDRRLYLQLAVGHKESHHVSPRNMTINTNPSPLPHKEDLKLLSFELNVVYRRNESLNCNNIAIGKVSML